MLNNYARDGMTVNGDPFGGTGAASNEDGGDIDLEKWSSRVWWGNSMNAAPPGPEFGFNPEEVPPDAWEWSDKYRLPVLRGMPGDREQDPEVK